MKDLQGVKLIAFVIIQVEIKDKFFAPADFILLFIWVYPFEFFLLPYLTSNSATSVETGSFILYLCSRSLYFISCSPGNPEVEVIPNGSFILSLSVSQVLFRLDWTNNNFWPLLHVPDTDDVKQKNKTLKQYPEQKTNKSFVLHHLYPVHEVLNQFLYHQVLV